MFRVLASSVIDRRCNVMFRVLASSVIDRRCNV